MLLFIEKNYTSVTATIAKKQATPRRSITLIALNTDLSAIIVQSCRFAEAELDSLELVDDISYWISSSFLFFSSFYLTLSMTFKWLLNELS